MNSSGRILVGVILFVIGISMVLLGVTLAEKIHDAPAAAAGKEV